MNIDRTEPAASAGVAEVEREVEARSAVFKKELGLFDLVLTQVVFVVGTFWSAGPQGSVTSKTSSGSSPSSRSTFRSLLR